MIITFTSKCDKCHTGEVNVIKADDNIWMSIVDLWLRHSNCPICNSQLNIQTKENLEHAEGCIFIADEQPI